jgi:hypothetical protein
MGWMNGAMEETENTDAIETPNTETNITLEKRRYAYKGKRCPPIHMPKYFLKFGVGL